MCCSCSTSTTLSLSSSVHSPTRAAFVSATITVVFANSLSLRRSLTAAISAQRSLSISIRNFNCFTRTYTHTHRHIHRHIQNLTPTQLRCLSNCRQQQQLQRVALQWNGFCCCCCCILCFCLQSLPLPQSPPSPLQQLAAHCCAFLLLHSVRRGSNLISFQLPFVTSCDEAATTYQFTLHPPTRPSCITYTHMCMYVNTHIHTYVCAARAVCSSPLK